jgi:hypothetical protein
VRISTFDSDAIKKAVSFIDSLRTDETRTEYFEVAQKDHTEHKVYNQSQYLLLVTFELLGRLELAQRIRVKHRPDEPDNDPTRAGHKANDRFCVLEGDTEEFYLAGQKNAESNDEMALLAAFWLEKDHRLKIPNLLYRMYARRLWKKLLSRYDPSKGVLEMDKAEAENEYDGKKGLHAIYKLALFGISAAKMGDKQTLNNVKSKLQGWQDDEGGWVTDLTLDLEFNGVANIETTALSILTLNSL